MLIKMSLIPWSRIGSWECTNCGLCCSRFKIILGQGERDDISAQFGQGAIIDHDIIPKIRKYNGGCFFQRWENEYSYCLLHNTGLKPSACRIFPFLVSPKPLRKRYARDSYYDFRGQVLCIYANSRCPSLKPGSPSNDLVEKILPEIAEIAINNRSKQRYSTSQTDSS